jgi:hypothetical protein
LRSFLSALHFLPRRRSGSHPKLSEELVDKSPFAQCNGVVQWKHSPTEVNQQKVLIRRGVVRRRYGKIALGAHTISASAPADLANDSDVVFIAPDRPVHAKLDYTAAAVDAPSLGAPT